MRSQPFGMCVGLLLLLTCCLLFSTPALMAQSAPSGPEVISAKQHDVSPPLRDIPPVPESKSKREMHRHDTNTLPLAPTPPQTDPVLQTSAGPLVATTSGLSFAGVGQGDYGHVVNVAPPDTNGAVGATQFLQWVNTSFAVFDKTTGALLYGPAAGNTFWSGFGDPCQSSNSGDPIAQYDKAAGRWVVTQPVFSSPYKVCVAVSTTSDATGSYNRYVFPMSSYFPDYPKLAVWSDAYYMSFNSFSVFGPFSIFQGANVCALDRAQMLIGAAATMHCFQLSSSFGSLLPSDLDGKTAPPAGSPDFFVNFGTNSLNLWKFHVDFTTPANSTFTGPTSISVAAFSPACNGGGTCIPQLGTSQQLDSLADRLMYRLAYRNFGDHESLVVNHSVTAGSSVGVRWYELRSPNATPNVFQQGTFAPDADYRWMGSVAMDSAGDIAVGYSASSSSINPGIRYTGRTSSDPLGVLQAESTILNGTGSQLSGLSRWGDYSSMSVDPVDDCTFWYTNEYLKADGTFNWSTLIASFKFSGCGTPPTPDFSLSATPISQTVVQGNGTSYTVNLAPSGGFSGTVSFSVSGLPSGASDSFNPTSVTGSGSTTLTVTTSANTPAGSYPLTITGTSGSLTHTTSVTLVVNPAPAPDFTISATPSSRTVTAGAGTTYTATVTAVNGFAGTVTLSLSGLPAGASGTFNPASVAGSGTSTLSISTTSSTPAGSYLLTITGTSGSLTHATSVTLVVSSAGGGGDFSISASPSSQTVSRSHSTTYTITITPTGGFSGTVSLSVSGLPNRTSASFNPATVTGSGMSTLTVTPGRKAPTGTFTLTIRGASGSITRSTTVTLLVQ